LSQLHELTRPSDRRRFDEQIASRLLEAERQQRRFAVVVVGADSLAWINRRWGRAAGDSVLRKLGRRLLASLAPDDSLMRYDGNRYGIIRWAPSTEQAVAFAQHLVSRIANTPFDIPDSHDAAFMTASIGVALAEPGAPAAEIATAAEQALRSAKDAGGNRVVPSPLPAQPGDG
jgi:two-component system cell cycle response regulator